MNSRQKTCVLVVGMHRSGTSALTRVISLHGITLPATLLGPNPGNEGGHWEPEQIVLLHDRLLDELGGRWDDWGPIDVTRLKPERFDYYTSELRRMLSEDFGDASLFVLKDPRIARLLPLWSAVAASENIDLRVALIFRNPLEVVDSLEARKLSWTDESTRADAAFLWMRYVLDAEAASRHLTRVTISFEALLRDWKSCLGKLIVGLGITLQSRPEQVAPEIESFLSAEQRHHLRSNEDVRIDPSTRTWIAEVYEAMQVLEATPGSLPAMETLDRVRSEFEQATPAIAQLVVQKRENFERRAAKLSGLIAVNKNEIRALEQSLADCKSELELRSSVLWPCRLAWRTFRLTVSQLVRIARMRLELLSSSRHNSPSR